MAWTGHFVETNYEERAEFLYHFLKMYEICTKDTEKAFSDTLKFLLGGMMLRKEPRYISEGVQAILIDEVEEVRSVKLLESTPFGYENINF